VWTLNGRKNLRELDFFCKETGFDLKVIAAVPDSVEILRLRLVAADSEDISQSTYDEYVRIIGQLSNLRELEMELADEICDVTT